MRAPAPAATTAEDAQQRLAALLRDHYAFVWRCVRRFGVFEASVDDVVQEVFIIISQKLDQVEQGRERAFMTSTALHLANNFRRSARRQPPRCELSELDSAATDASVERLNPEALLEQRRNRRLLDDALDRIPLEQRAPFVLMEIEGLTRAEAAALLELPMGTVATRVRNARKQFEREVRRLLRDVPEPPGCRL